MIAHRLATIKNADRIVVVENGSVAEHGAPDLPSALTLLRASAADGITDAVLTPHVYPGRWDNTLTNMRPKFQALCEQVEIEQIPIRLHLGGEVHLLPESLMLCDQGDLPLIGIWQGMRVVLLEFRIDKFR